MSRTVNRRGFLASTAVAAAAAVPLWAEDRAPPFDVVVLGGTPGGIAAAVTAARLGRSVALAEYHPRLGGMSASGIGKSDIEHRPLIRGLFAEFVGLVRKHYTDKYGAASQNVKLCKDGYFFEPSAAESIYDRMLKDEQSIAVYRSHALVGVEVTSNRLVAARLQDRVTGAVKTLRGRMFVDATYEGDLYASAGAEFRLGREGRDEFSEPHAGHVYFDYRKQEFLPGGTGKGDNRLTAYTYRLCLTDDPENAHRLDAPPPGYEPAKYLGYLEDARSGSFDKDPNPLHIAFTIARLPNHKTDVNMKPRPLGFVFAEENAGYVTADWVGREKICEKLRTLTLGLLWFLQHDERISAVHRAEANRYHLPKDEFADTGHFPFQLYVREARRLVGEYTLTEHDVAAVPGRRGTGRHEDAVALGEFPIDSFPTQKRQPGDTVVVEGYLGMLSKVTRPYQIPYRIMVPRRVDGLLVPVAASTTHVAYSTIRMEPTWTVLGQAAGVAAHVALARGVEPRRVPVGEVQAELRREGQVLDLPPE